LRNPTLTMSTIVPPAQTIAVTAVETVAGVPVEEGFNVHSMNGRTDYGPIVGYEKKRCCNYLRGTTVKFLFAQDHASLSTQNGELKALVKKLDSEKAAEAQAQKDLKTALDSANATISNQTKAIEERIKVHTAETERQKQAHEIEVQELRTKFNKDLVEAKELGQDQVDTLTAAHEANLKVLEDRHQSILKSRTDELAKTHAALLTTQKKMSDLDSKHRTLASDLEQAKIALEGLTAEKEKLEEKDSAEFKALELEIRQREERITILQKEAADVAELRLKLEEAAASAKQAKDSVKDAQDVLGSAKNDTTIITTETRQETAIAAKTGEAPSN